MDDTTRQTWRDAREHFLAALKVARTAWPTETPDAVVNAAAIALMEAVDRRTMSAQPAAPDPPASEALASAPTACPDCGSAIFDNRRDKSTGLLPAKRPDFKCKDSDCGWVQWPPRKRTAR